VWSSIIACVACGSRPLCNAPIADVVTMIVAPYVEHCVYGCVGAFCLIGICPVAGVFVSC
jgi:hypothetical protein